MSDLISELTAPTRLQNITTIINTTIRSPPPPPPAVAALIKGYCSIVCVLSVQYKH